MFACCVIVWCPLSSVVELDFGLDVGIADDRVLNVLLILLLRWSCCCWLSIFALCWFIIVGLIFDVGLW